ncbi:MAG: glycosyltransferase, partial [Calditrichia bacterium]
RMNSGHELPERTTSSKDRFDKKTVLWVATMGPRKQPWKFVDLVRQCQDKNWHFVMVGGHSDQQYLNSFLKDVPDNLHCTGRLPFEEALAWFNKATVFVNTSTSEGEGFPNTFIQSWLRGVPVVSLTVDPDDILKKKELGYIAHGDFERMKADLENLLTNMIVYNSHSERVSAFARNNYTVDKVVDQFLEVIYPTHKKSSEK